MKTNSYLIALGLLFILISCKKNSTSTNPDTLAALNATWVNSAYGGVNNNAIKISIVSTTSTGTVTAIGAQGFGISVGDLFFTSITAGTAGAFTGMGLYTYGANNQKGTRAVVLTLQNNNSQLTADYPALNASFPEIIYVYQKQ